MSSVRGGVGSVPEIVRDRVFFVLLSVALLLRIPLLTRPLTDSHTDSWRQTDTASIARHFYRGGYQLFHPQVYWGGSGPAYTETEFQLHPFVTALLYGAFGEQVWLGRLVSLTFAMLGLCAFYFLARRVAGERVALFGLGFLALSPLHVRYSTAFMPEATVLCFYVAALYFFQRWLDEQRSRDLWLAGGATALAILVKPTSIQVGLVFALLLLFRERLRFLSRLQMWGFALVCLAPGVAWYWHARNLYLTYGNTFGILSGGDSKLGNASYWLSPHFYFAVAKLEAKWVFAWSGVLLFAWGAYVCLRKRTSWLPLFGTLTAAIYYMAVARYASEVWGIQYHVFFLPFAALVVGIGLSEIGWSLSPRAGIAAIALLVAVIGSAKLYAELFEPVGEKLATCGRLVAERTPEGALLVVSTTSEADTRGTPNNYQEPQVFFFADRHGWSLPSDRHTPEAVEQLRREGASYFVAYDEPLLLARPGLRAYLESHSEQIGEGLESGCAIYRLRPGDPISLAAP
jgi:4-amino-4-deoxy-L-arabinose transferase-like glycosyltransferase